MRHSNQGRFRHQVQFLRRQFLQDGDLPFTDVLSEDLVTRTTHGGRRILERPNLFAARHALGLSQPGLNAGPLLPARPSPA